jgi:hypothetical protein
MLHFYAAVAQQNESATLLTPKMRVQLLPAANLGVTVIVTANPCKIERRGAIPRISTNYPVAQQKRERFPAKEEAASGILAGITILWMVNRTTAPNLS